MNYLAHFLLDVTAYTAPLSEMMKNRQPFYWCPLHSVCFQSIKDLCCKVPILCPINTAIKKPIWVICDASISGVGAMYGQGPTWQTCRPAGFMSKKFMDSQRNYCVFETETLVMLEALLKWEDKLIGYCIHVVTDHKALEFFKTQRHLSNHQMRWMEYLSCFDFNITYVKGVSNKVADALSHYYKSDTPEDQHQLAEFVNADICIDKLGEDLPLGCKEEAEEMVIRLNAMETCRESARLKEKHETRELEAEEMENAQEPEETEPVQLPKVNPTVIDSRDKGKNL